MNLIMRIWNSLNEKGRRAWVDTGKAMADMKGGIYAAEEQPQTRSHKFNEKDQQTDRPSDCVGEWQMKKNTEYIIAVTMFFQCC